jgi:cell division protease FtsH
VTIIPRGRALGVTHFLPEADRISASKRKLLGEIDTLYGGRIAEELIYGEDGVSTGASSDINMATAIARNMVSSYGLSDKLGPLDYDSYDNQGYGNKHISSETQALVDAEIKVICDESYARAYKVMEENMDILHAMKDAMMEYETLDSDQVGDLMARKPVRLPKDWDDGADGSSGSVDGSSDSVDDSSDSEDEVSDGDSDIADAGDPVSDH